jgi:hypothetical protein
LNAPDHLARLVAQHNDLLGLEPMGPQHFDEVAAIPYPPRTPGPAPDDVAPAPDAEMVVVISEPVPLDSWPVPMSRPVAWRLE